MPSLLPLSTVRDVSNEGKAAGGRAASAPRGLAANDVGERASAAAPAAAPAEPPPCECLDPSAAASWIPREAGPSAEAREAARNWTVVPLLTRRHAVVNAAFLLAALVSWACFWATFGGWLLASHTGLSPNGPRPPLSILFGSLSAYEMFEHLYRICMLFAAARASLPPLAAPPPAPQPQPPHRLPPPDPPSPPHHPPPPRVAMVVTKVPSEPLPMVAATLSGCLSQQLPDGSVSVLHVWLADEDPSPDTLSLCAEAGVRISCRKGAPGYHNAAWPRRRRCKEGNLSYFYDTIGYFQYDVVAQFDADHVPTPTYLAAALPWFINPIVGFVACPSICDANKRVSWAVRGRLWLEAYMHGPNGASRAMWALPCCIGSHYLVRTAALRDIGGIGPDLDEDYSTSMMMTCTGWKGGFSVDSIAHGDGPTTFEDAMRQEFQWARSALVIALRYTARPAALCRLSVAESLHLMYFNWFWVYTASMPFALLAFILLPSVGFASVQGWPFLLALLLPVALIQSLQLIWVRSLGLLRPSDSMLQFLSPATFLHRVCAPLWTAQGVAAGVMGGLFSVEWDFKVTPKGALGERLLGWRSLAPLLALSALCSAVLLIAGSPTATPGVLALSCLYLCAATAVAALHVIENGQCCLSHTQARNKAQLCSAIGSAAALLAAAVLLGPLVPPRVLRPGG